MYDVGTKTDIDGRYLVGKVTAHVSRRVARRTVAGSHRIERDLVENVDARNVGAVGVNNYGSSHFTPAGSGRGQRVGVR